MQGKIIKGIAGFYYVHVNTKGIYECKAKGSFRKQGQKPLVGDDVILEILDEDKMLGNIEQILPRKNELIRPSVAGIDQAIVIFSLTHPAPNFNLLDRFLVMMEYQDIPCIICFNKEDIASSTEIEIALDAYKNTGYEVIVVSAKTKKGIAQLNTLLEGKTTTVAGPSGVGKSSIINLLQSNISMETGEISTKIERGKHTTRHTQLIAISEDTYIMDTPGFSSLKIMVDEKEELQDCYPEFVKEKEFCKFRGCAHMAEPNCGIKDAVEAGKISKERYKNYQLLYEELNQIRKYK